MPTQLNQVDISLNEGGENSSVNQMILTCKRISPHLLRELSSIDSVVSPPLPQRKEFSPCSLRELSSCDSLPPIYASSGSADVALFFCRTVEILFIRVLKEVFASVDVPEQTRLKKVLRVPYNWAK